MEPNTPWIVALFSRVTRAGRFAFFISLIVEVVIFSIAGGWSWMAAQHMSRHDPRTGLMVIAAVGIPVILALAANAVSGNPVTDDGSAPVNNMDDTTSESFH